MENTASYESARAQATLLLPQLESYNLTHSQGKGTVSGKNRVPMFQPVCAQWQPNSCLLAAVGCTNFGYFFTAMSIVKDVKKLIWVGERRPPSCK